MKGSLALPRVAFLNVLLACGLATVVVLLRMNSRMSLFLLPVGLNRTDDNVLDLSQRPRDVLVPEMKQTVRLVSPGENIQVEDLQVHITTAVYYENYPAENAFNVILNGWARRSTDMSFKCCFMRTVPNGALNSTAITEVQAYKYNIYKQWLVDMQNAEFSCSVSNEQLKSIGDTKFRYVTFAKKSCHNAHPLIMDILYPQPVPQSVGVCLKITYGTLNTTNMVEWFEYTRLMNVTKVFTYYYDVDPQVLKVLQYYRDIGFLDLLLIHPAKSKHGAARGFRRPRFEQQAWVDEVMAANDCKHRMAKFDYVIIMDIDEFIVPKGDLKTYYDILKTRQNIDQNAGGFSFDSYVKMLNWGQSRSSPLHLTSFTYRTKWPNYDGRTQNTRWGFQPNRTFWVQNNLVHLRKNFVIVNMNTPKELCILYHYRKCKDQWRGCLKRRRVQDNHILQYEPVMVDRILSLPLDDVLYDDKRYVTNMKAWKNERNSENFQNGTKT